MGNCPACLSGSEQAKPNAYTALSVSTDLNPAESSDSLQYSPVTNTDIISNHTPSNNTTPTNAHEQLELHRKHLGDMIIAEASNKMMSVHSRRNEAGYWRERVDSNSNLNSNSNSTPNSNVNTDNNSINNSNSNTPNNQSQSQSTPKLGVSALIKNYEFSIKPQDNKLSHWFTNKFSKSNSTIPTTTNSDMNSVLDILSTEIAIAPSSHMLHHQSFEEFADYFEKDLVVENNFGGDSLILVENLP